MTTKKNRPKNRKTTVNLYAYKCNGHTEGGKPGQAKFDYLFYFKSMLDCIQESTHVYGEESKEKIILTYAEEFDDVLFFQIAETTGKDATVYDLEQRRIIRVKAGESQEFANEIWIAILKSNPRYLAIQRKFKGDGVSIQNITKILEKLSKKIYGDKSIITLEPVISSSFAREVEKLERVTKASIRVNRPNYNWHGFSSVVDSLGQASDAGSISIEATANRGETLEKDEGIVKDVKNISNIPIPGIESAKIAGYPQDSKTLQVISTKNNLLKEKRQIDRSNEKSFKSGLRSLVTNLISQIPK